MLSSIIISVQSYIAAHRFIQKNKLWKWIFLPGIFYATLFCISMYFFGKTNNQFIEWLSLKTGLKSWLDKTNNGFLGFLFTLTSLTLWINMLLFYFSLFKYFFLLVGAPIFSYLSEKTTAILEQKEITITTKQVLADAYRGGKVALRNSLWQILYAFCIVLLSLIPLIGLLTPLVLIIIECYYYGFSMIDYNRDRYKKNTTETADFITHHKGLAIGNGILFYMMHFLPVIGWILAPSYAIVAATFGVTSTMKEKK